MSPGPNNITPADLPDIISRQSGNTFQKARALTPRTPGIPDLDGTFDTGFLDDGTSYAFDTNIGGLRPGRPEAIPFSWPGLVLTGGLSGPHLLMQGNVSRITMVTLGVGTVDTGAAIEVNYVLNGTTFQTLTLPMSVQFVYERNPNDGSWPAIGGNDTDYFQVQISSAGSVAEDLVAAIRVI